MVIVIIKDRIKLLSWFLANEINTRKMKKEMIVLVIISKKLLIRRSL